MPNNTTNTPSWLSYIANNRLRSFLVLLALITFIYIPIIKYGYSYHDDPSLINSPQLKLSNSKDIFTTGVFHFTGELAKEKDLYYRPMQNLFYAAVKDTFGKSAGTFHFSGILLHIVACWLLFILLSAFIQSKEAALLLTGIFAIHPVVTQAVAWIPGAIELLVALFILPCFLLLRNFLQADTIKPLNALGICAFFLLALLSKESSIAFAPLAVLYAIFFTENRKQFPIKLGVLFITLAIPASIWWYLRTQVVGQYSHVNLHTITFSLLQNSGLLIAYPGKVLIPFSLSPLPSITDVSVIIGLIATVALIAVSFVVKEKKNIKLILFGLAWYLLFLVPTLYVQQEDATLYAYNHRLYLPLMGLLIVAAELFALNRPTAVKTYASLAVLILFTISSISYMPSFKNKYSFYKTAIANSPHSWLAYEGLGKIYMNEQKCDEALPVYKGMVEVAPTPTHAYYGLVGNAYMCLNDFQNSLVWYKKAMSIDSLSRVTANTCISIANIYNYQFKDLPKAKYWYMQSYKRDSSIAFPLETIGNIYLETVNYDSATYWYNKAIKADSNSSPSYNGLGAIQYNKANYPKAAEFYLKALSIRPDDKAVIKNMAGCYMMMNDYANTLKYTKQYAATGEAVPSYLQQYLDNNNLK